MGLCNLRVFIDLATTFGNFLDRPVAPRCRTVIDRVGNSAGAVSQEVDQQRAAQHTAAEKPLQREYIPNPHRLITVMAARSGPLLKLDRVTLPPKLRHSFNNKSRPASVE
jgi:hypothetical protein